MGSIRLYKRAACTSRENGTLLPTRRGRLRGLSAVEEVATGLAERLLQTLNPLPGQTTY